MGKEKNILANIISVIIPLSFFIIELFTLISFFKGEYSDKYYQNLSENWNETPIIKIEIEETINETKFDNKEYYEFAYYPGLKNLYGNYLIPSKTIYKLYNKFFIITRMSSNYNYPKIFSNPSNSNYKICGKDSTGKKLYFENNIECPINYISIGNESIIEGLKEKIIKIPLKNDLYLFYSNEFVNNKIVTNLELSLLNPSYSSDYTENICNGFSCCGTLNLKDNSQNLNDSSYIKLYSIKISDVLKNNNINQDIQVIYKNFTKKSAEISYNNKNIHNNSSVKQSSILCYSKGNEYFSLYGRFYIGLENYEVDSSLINKVISLPNNSQFRNIFEMIVSLLILIFYKGLKVQISKEKFNLGTITALSLIFVFSLINIFLGTYIIILNNKMTSNILRKVSDELLIKSYDHQKWFILLSITKIIFNVLIILCIILYLIIFIKLRKEFKKNCLTCFCCFRKLKLKEKIAPLLEEFDEECLIVEKKNKENEVLKKNLDEKKKEKNSLQIKLNQKEIDIEKKKNELGIDKFTDTIVDKVKKNNKELENKLLEINEKKKEYEDFLKRYHELSQKEKDIEQKYEKFFEMKKELEKKLKDLENIKDEDPELYEKLNEQYRNLILQFKEKKKK